ncbi:histidinol-phosphate transaminase [Borealophlyctis nickersoniae]|nr:histidinol-phosphate transaminase [Borealophlyctis nickersoniae]
MYSVCAQVNGVEVMKVPLDIEEGRFQLRTDEIFKAIDTDPLIKIIFICSPGNPTGTLINHEDIKKVLNYEGYKGVVAVDEAYVDFCEGHGNTAASVARWVVEYPNLLVMQTLSKSFGLAGIRLGITISSCELAQIFNNTKAPYNISTTTSIIGRAALSQEGLAKMREHVSLVLAERSRLIESLKKMRGVGKILGGNNANFVMAEILDDAGKPCNEKAYAVYKQLAESEGVVVRFRGMEYGCTGCLRITVGTEEENRVLLAKMEKLLR